MKTLTSKYISVLVVLTLVIMGSQMLMQKTINDSKTDARIINVSGRQRMLSQKMTKAALKLTRAKDLEAFTQAREELSRALQLWVSSHEKLKSGSSELDVTKFNESVRLQQLFRSIQPHYTEIRLAAMSLISMDFQTLTTGQNPFIQAQLIHITDNETAFLDLMNQITYEYDHLASSKIKFLSQVEYSLLTFTLLLILIEILLVFRPMFKASKVKDAKIDELTSIMNEEKSFASDQIDQANKAIRSLRRLAKSLKQELDENQKDYTVKTSQQMKKYLDLNEQHSRLKENNELLRVKFKNFSGGSFSNN